MKGPALAFCYVRVNIDFRYVWIKADAKLNSRWEISGLRDPHHNSPDQEEYVTVTWIIEADKPAPTTLVFAKTNRIIIIIQLYTREGCHEASRKFTRLLNRRGIADLDYPAMTKFQILSPILAAGSDATSTLRRKTCMDVDLMAQIEIFIVCTKKLICT